MTLKKGSHSGACAAWTAKLERSLAQVLEKEPANYIEAIQQFIAPLSKDRIAIEGDDGEESDEQEYVDAVMVDVENIALFEYEDDPEAGTGVIVFHITDSAAWEKHLGYYEDRFFDPEDVERLNKFHAKHLKSFQQHKASSKK